MTLTDPLISLALSWLKLSRKLASKIAVKGAPS